MTSVTQLFFDVELIINANMSIIQPKSSALKKKIIIITEKKTVHVCVDATY